MKRIIIHSDLNNFFASVECMKNPWLYNVPMAVTGESEQRHGIILAKNRFAVKYGIKTGEQIWRAVEKCPDLVTVSPKFDDYIVVSEQVRKIYEKYSANIEAFGIDECWIDVSNITQRFNEGKLIADTIRNQIRESVGITASCGVSYNKTFAKLASEIKKPDATTVIDDIHYKDIVWKMPAEDMLFIGRSAKRSLSAVNIHTIGDIAQSDIRTLSFLFGKNGEAMWHNANGLDLSPVRKSDTVSAVKSVSNSITTNHDLTSEEEVRIVLYALCEKVSTRLRRLNFLCATLALQIKDNSFFIIERQCPMTSPCRTAKQLFDTAFFLLKKHCSDKQPIRSIGIRVSNLCCDKAEQTFINNDRFTYDKRECAELAADTIRNQFGRDSLFRGIMLSNNVLSNVDFGEEKCSFTSR